jgi:hypothetical protein
MVHFGYSPTLKSNELARYFELGVKDKFDRRPSRFEVEFGSDYVDPGTFGIYSKEAMGLKFDANSIRRDLPPELSVDGLAIWSVDFARIESMFFIINSATLSARQNGELFIVDSVDIPSV